jgi:hypothetical protein
MTTDVEILETDTLRSTPSRNPGSADFDGFCYDR